MQPLAPRFAEVRELPRLPIGRDHANNTLTTLKLYECIKGFRRLKKVVYSAAGCSVAEKTFAARSRLIPRPRETAWTSSPSVQ